MQARQDASKAVKIEPGNSAYQTLYRQMNGQSETYQQRSNAYSMPLLSIGRICLTYIAINLLFRLCGAGAWPILCCL